MLLLLYVIKITTAVQFWFPFNLSASSTVLPYVQLPLCSQTLNIFVCVTFYQAKKRQEKQDVCEAVEVCDKYWQRIGPYSSAQTACVQTCFSQSRKEDDITQEKYDLKFSIHSFTFSTGSRMKYQVCPLTGVWTCCSYWFLRVTRAVFSVKRVQLTFCSLVEPGNQRYAGAH